MLIVLVRHAHAVDDLPGLDDTDRWLTAKGRRRARSLGELLRRHRVRPTLLAASPLVRAQQTAEVLSGPLGYGGVIEAWHELSTLGSPRKACERLASARGALLLVGHEPGVAVLASLLGGDGRPFRKAEARGFENGAERWVLHAE